MAGKAKNSKVEKQSSLMNGLKRPITFDDDNFSFYTTKSNGEDFLILKNHPTDSLVSIPIEYLSVLKPVVDSQLKLRAAIAEINPEPENEELENIEETIEETAKKEAAKILADLEKEKKTTKNPTPKAE